jgi:hypothetical protein
MNGGGIIRASMGYAPTRSIVRAAMGYSNTAGLIRAAAGASPTRDSVRLLARPGEAVLRNSAVDMIGEDTVNMLNAMGNSKRSPGPPPPAPEPRKPDMVNVYVVQKDSVPPLGAKDVVAMVGEDIQKGGQTKRLIKAVAMGQM